jgi:hypothetical protein
MKTYVLLIDGKVAATYRAKDTKAAVKSAEKKSGILYWLIWRRDGKVAGVRDANMHEHAAWRASQVREQISREASATYIEELAVERGVTEREIVATLSGSRLSEVPKDRNRVDYDPDTHVWVNFDFLPPSA